MNLTGLAKTKRILSRIIWGGVLSGALMLPFSSFAIVVTDPGAYSRMALQLKEMGAMITSLKQQIATLEQMRELEGVQIDQLDSIQDKLAGDATIGADMAKDMKQLQQMVTQLPLWEMMGIDPRESNAELYNMADFSQMIESIYVPKSREPYGLSTHQQVQKSYQQQLVKAQLEQAETALQRVSSSMQSIEGLAGKAEQAKTVKEAQDVQNALLTKLIAGQQQMIILLAHLSRADAAMQYQGIDAENIHDQLNKAEENQPYWKKRWEEHQLRKSRGAGKTSPFESTIPCPRVIRAQGGC